jgi:hypothetical protein
VKIETLLPLAKVVPGLRASETPLDIHRGGRRRRICRVARL